LSQLYEVRQRAARERGSILLTANVYLRMRAAESRIRYSLFPPAKQKKIALRCLTTNNFYSIFNRFANVNNLING
jgi:hypothetical protein